MKKRQQHVRINRNLCNRPLARDSRTLEDEWRPTPKGTRIKTRLPGTNYVWVYLPADFDEPRIPNGFDTAVLYQLLAQARMAGSRKIEVKSLNELLRRLAKPAQSRERQKLQRALTLWSHLRVRYTAWYRPPKYDYIEKHIHGEWRKVRRKTRLHARFDKTLAAPLKVVSLRPLVLRLHKDWYDLQGSWEESIPLPLPTNAVMQNVVLVAHAKPNAIHSLRSWCRIFGINHKARNQRVERIVNAMVGGWLAVHSDKIIRLVDAGGGRFQLILKTPKQILAEAEIERGPHEGWVGTTRGRGGDHMREGWGPHAGGD